MKQITLLMILLLFGLVTRPQSYTLRVAVRGQPKNPVVLGLIRGDRFTPVDSAFCDKLTQAASFKIPSSSTPLMYRLVFGQTLMAKVMNEPPQQLDFIFNNESIVFETNFNSPEDSLKILQSEENRPWFAFRKELKMYGQWMARLTPYLHAQNSGNPTELSDKKNEYNRVLMEREAFIQKSAGQNPQLFASKLMKMYREPLLDAFLTEQEWTDSYRKEYFVVLDFTDPELVNTPVYTEKSIQYIQSYARKGLTREQQENEFIKAVGVLLGHVNKNPAVSELILDYLMRGFEKLGLQKTLEYIAEKYSALACPSDEKTTLKRRLGFQNMRIGSPAPDFTLNDSNGSPVTFSRALKNKTLLIFWASWCPQCGLIIPELKKLGSMPDVEIVAVSLDTSKTDWLAEIRGLGVEGWVNLSDMKGWDGEVALKYNVYATPTMFIIDKGLKIVSKPMAVEEIARELNHK